MKPRTPRRTWRPAELDFLRTHASWPAQQVATYLGRTVRGVYSARATLGLVRPKADFGPAFEAFVREKNADGWPDAEIARAWKCDRHAVGTRRRKLGLPCHACCTGKPSARVRDQVRQRTSEQLARAGLPSIGHLRKEAFRARAVAAGWPEDLRPRAVQILNALWDRGPMTRREIADAIGMPWKGSRKSLVSNDPEGSYLAHLTARGLMLVLKRAHQVTGQGKGRSCDVYTLPLWIERKAHDERKDERTHAA